MQLDYGQPLGAVVQYAYVVEDIESAILHYVGVLGIGPWYVLGPFVPAKGLYRGKPTEVEVTLAMAFSGHAMIELIQQHNQAPSVYLETIERAGYGFHHVAVVSNDFDRDLARYRQNGLQLAFSDEVLGSRIAYLDTTTFLPGMLELMEWSPALEQAQAVIWQAAQGWDGSDPIRRLPAPASAQVDGGSPAQ